MIANNTNSEKKTESNLIYPELSYKVMDAIFEVHKELGPGFLETIYEKALIEELTKRGIKVEPQKVINLTYKNKKVRTHRLDLVVDDKFIVELKTADRFSVHHKAQLTSYLKASAYKLEILVNFSKSKVEYQRVVIR